MRNLKMALIISGGILSSILVGVFAVQGVQNKAIVLEEQVNTA